MAKKRKSRKKPSANNSMLMLIAIIVILAIVSVATAYFILNDDGEVDPVETIDVIEIQTNDKTKKTEEQISISTPIDGTWVSNYDGAMLSISGTTFTLELPSVDASQTAKGNITIQNTLVIFSNSTGNKTCIGKEGHYKFSFENDELKLTKIKDPCESRSERMTESWFRL